MLTSLVCALKLETTVLILSHVQVLAMASVIKISYHKRLFLMLLSFLWTMIFCFTFFQYFREKHFKSELVNAQLQLYNHKLLTLVEDGSPYEDFIVSEEKPFDDLRISIIATTGTVVFDNTLSVDSLDNHSHRPEIVATMKNGEAYHAGR